MLRTRVLIFVAIVLAVSFPVLAQGAPGARSTPVAGPTETIQSPLPLHTIEGESGGLLVPSAYLANPGPKGAIFGMPSVSASYINMGSKNLWTVGITEVVWRRIELGYAFNYFDLGSMNDLAKKFGADLGTDDVMLHHFNVRGQIIEENSWGFTWMPAVTLGVHYKYNDGIRGINKHLGGGLNLIGYDSKDGWDVTLRTGKTFPTLAWGRPIIVSGGLRSTEAAQTGLFGFGDDRRFFMESSVAYMPTDKWYLAYEFREKASPYDNAAPLMGKEHSWHALSATYIVNDRLTVSGVLGAFGTIGNSSADPSVGLQVKYEF
jgi:hypothetical protein